MPVLRALIAFALALAAASAVAHVVRSGAPQRIDTQLVTGTATRAAPGQSAPKTSAAKPADTAQGGGLRAPVGALAFAVVGAVLLLRGRVPESRQQPRGTLND